MALLLSGADTPKDYLRIRAVLRVPSPVVVWMWMWRWWGSMVEMVRMVMW